MFDAHKKSYRSHSYKCIHRQPGQPIDTFCSHCTSSSSTTYNQTYATTKASMPPHSNPTNKEVKESLSNEKTGKPKYAEDTMASTTTITRFSKSAYRLLMINDRHKSHVRFNSTNNVFEMHLHPFGWTECTPDDMLYISDANKRQYKKEPDVQFVIKDGGYRNDFSTTDDKSCSNKQSHEYKPAIYQFLQEEHKMTTKLDST